MKKLILLFFFPFLLISCDAPAVAVDLIYGCDFVVDLNNASAESKKTEIFVVRSSDGISWYVEENRSKTMTVLPGSSLKTTLNAFLFM